jgi:type IV secretory pathway TrbD component
MTAVERVNFVVWAAKRDPKFTLSRRAYVQALWDWRTVVRKDPKLRRVVG